MIRSPLVLLCSLGLLIGLILTPAGVNAAQPGCQLVLGFKTLHDLIPNVVGPCLENEHRARWHGMAAYIPQTVYLLDDSLRRNVALGVPDTQIDDAVFVPTTTRDREIFFPWFDTRKDAIRHLDVSPPEEIHRRTLEVLKA